MRQRKMTIAAVACGLACVLFVGLFMYSVQGEASAARAEALARYGGEQVEICLATRDIAAGERVDASAVETRLWIADLLPDGAVRETGAVIGRTATSSILKNEVISEKRFEMERESLEVPAGKQAVSVPAKAVQAVGGAVQRGAVVDVYSTGDTSTSLIAEEVTVLAASVGESGSLTSSGSGWVTLAVDPEHVQEIVAASNKANLYFVLPGNSVPEPASQLEDDEEGSTSEQDSKNAQQSGQAKSKGSGSSGAKTEEDDGEEEEDGKESKKESENEDQKEDEKEDRREEGDDVLETESSFDFVNSSDVSQQSNLIMLEDGE